MSRRALILGAKSAIAQALARQLAAAGYDLALGARQCQQLTPFAADTRLHSQTQVDLFEFDALDTTAHAGLPGRVEETCGPFELAILVFGVLGDQAEARDQTEALEQILHTNFTSAAVVAAHLANYLEARGGPGGLIGISSVAGDRGRQSNYSYGAAKGGFSLFLQGLRNRLAATPVHVMTVKPGFVDTPMIEGAEGLILVAPPDRVAGDILRAYRKKRDILYTPWFWRYIMLVTRCIPERLFKRLNL
ncbi:MAG: SDR family oxidoreductase [Candidatus Latescibacteria bacterium]|nr:SDR family oxidoreductase [Candidatus Latescibacterota bacterium]